NPFLMNRVCGTTKVVPSRVGWRHSTPNVLASRMAGRHSGTEVVPCLLGWRCDARRVVSCALFCSIDVQLGQASQKTGFVAQDRRGVVIGVAPLPIGKNQNAGCGLTDDARNLEAMLPCVLHPPIGDIGGVAAGATENLRGIGSFTG